MISPFSYQRLAKWYELGAAKYADRNWEKGLPIGRFLDSALRHINNFQLGKDDEDHLAAAVWNLFSIMHFQETGQFAELNNLPDYRVTFSPTEKEKLWEKQFEKEMEE